MLDRQTLIDWLRGLEGYAVAIFHFNLVQTGNDWYQVAASYGWLGVPVFFVISVYCTKFAAIRSRDWQSFLIAGIFLIWPLYVFSLVVVVA